MKSEPDPEQLLCTTCGVEIDECAMCERRDYKSAVCYRCMLRALGGRTVSESRES